MPLMPGKLSRPARAARIETSRCPPTPPRRRVAARTGRADRNMSAPYVQQLDNRVAARTGRADRNARGVIGKSVGRTSRPARAARIETLRTEIPHAALHVAARTGRADRNLADQVHQHLDLVAARTGRADRNPRISSNDGGWVESRPARAARIETAAAVHPPPCAWSRPARAARIETASDCRAWQSRRVAARTGRADRNIAAASL